MGDSKQEYTPLENPSECSGCDGRQSLAASYSASKGHLSRGILLLGITSVIGLLIGVIISSWFIIYWTAPVQQRCGLKTDTLFGDVPWHEIVLSEEKAFVETDPYDGRWEPYRALNSNDTTVWDDIWPSAWVAVPDPSIAGHGGGMKLKDSAVLPSLFESTSEGFVLAVMHQLHCVGNLKHAVVEFENSGTSTVPFEHMHHCVEILRQAIMCHGDLTLERPDFEGPAYRDASGWGNVHFCRDWTRILDWVSENEIHFTQKGWIRHEKDGF